MGVRSWNGNFVGRFDFDNILLILLVGISSKWINLDLGWVRILILGYGLVCGDDVARGDYVAGRSGWVTETIVFSDFIY